MTDTNHTYPADCPFREDHDRMVIMSNTVENINDGINGAYGVLAQLKALNGQTRQNEKDIARIMAVGGTLVVVIPVLIKVLWP